MNLLHFLLLHLALISFLGSPAEAATCDRIKEPWLDANCEPPKKENPNHACRLAAQMKAGQVNPFDPSLNDRLTVSGQEITWESYQSLAASTCDKIKKLRCAKTVNDLLQNLQAVQKVYILDEKSGLPLAADVQTPAQGQRNPNLFRNYEYLEAKAREIQQALHDVSRAMPAIAAKVNSDASLREARVDLFNRMSAIRNLMVPFSVGLRTFDLMKAGFAGKLTSISVEALGSADDFDCQGHTAAIEDYNKQVKQVVATTNDLSKEIFAFAKQNDRLFSETFYKWKYELHRNYAAAMKKDINVLIGAMRDDLALDRILWEMSDWWVSATINGLAGRLHTRYYYYSEPLRLLNLERAKATSFKGRIAELKTLESSVIEEAQKSVDAKIALIDQQISGVESKGWQGMLNLQTLSAQKRAELLPNNELCQKKTKEFLAAAATVNSLQSFDSTSPLYKGTVDSCIK